MNTGDTQQGPADTDDSQLSVRCDACAAALASPGRPTISFLLLDQFTIPLVGCDEHLEQFSSVCGLTTENGVSLLNHRPAGGLTCPGCRNASYNARQAVVPMAGGALAVIACPDHRSDIMERFRTGLETRHTLTASLEVV